MQLPTAYIIFRLTVTNIRGTKIHSALKISDLFSPTTAPHFQLLLKKAITFSIEEEQEALKCLEDAKYTELPLEKAFPMYWTVFRNKNFCFEFYDEAADISGEVYLFGKSVYICVTDYNLNGDFPLQTVFKAQNINADKIKELQSLHKVKFNQFIRYQDLYSDSPTHDWYENYVILFIAFSLAALIIIAIVEILLKKNPRHRRK